MKKIIALFPLFFLSGFITALAQDEDESDSLREIIVEDPSQYLPAYLDNVYIGMPMADFENIKDTSQSNISETNSDMWFGIKEEVNDEGIDEIVYKFDKEEKGINIERPLYQINIKFLVSDYENEYLSEKIDHQFNKGNTNKKWILKTNRDYFLIIKKIDDTVQIIATMPGTEWDKYN